MNNIEDVIYYRKVDGIELVIYRRNRVWFVGWFANQWAVSLFEKDEQQLEVIENEKYRQAAKNGKKYKEIKARFDESPFTTRYFEDGTVTL